MSLGVPGITLETIAFPFGMPGVMGKGAILGTRMGPPDPWLAHRG